MLPCFEQLGTDSRTIAERRKETTKFLVERLRAPRAAKPRKPLKKPQPLLLERGEGTCPGRPIEATRSTPAPRRMRAHGTDGLRRSRLRIPNRPA